MKVTVNLTKREMEAVLRSEGFTNGYGAIKSQALQTAQMKIIGAISIASDDLARYREPPTTGGDSA